MGCFWCWQAGKRHTVVGPGRGGHSEWLRFPLGCLESRFRAVGIWDGDFVCDGHAGNGTGLDGYLRTGKVAGSIHAFALELLPCEVIHGNKWMEPTGGISRFAAGISN